MNNGVTTNPKAESLFQQALAAHGSGQFSKAELWIFRPKTESHRRDLENHCSEQKVELRVFVEQQARP